MKKLTLTLICFLTLNFAALAQSNFDRGFKSGFNNGYCYSNQSSVYCTPPLPPHPPLPQISERSDNYQDGYNRGFLYGTAQRRYDDNYSSRQKSTGSPNPPKFNPYVLQSPILSLTPAEREAYYAAKARQNQETAEAIGFLLEKIFTVTPEGRARRAEYKAQQYDKQKRKDEENAKIKEEKKQAKIIIYGSDNYYKIKQSKKIWLGTTIGLGTFGTVSYLLSKSYYNQYQSATTDASNLYNKVELQNKIYPIAFGLAGLSALEVVLKSRKINKADKAKTSLNFFPLEYGGGIGLTYNF